MTFLSSKKSPFEEKTSSKVKKGLFYGKVGSNDIWNFGLESRVNNFKNMQTFQL